MCCRHFVALENPLLPLASPSMYAVTDSQLVARAQHDALKEGYLMLMHHRSPLVIFHLFSYSFNSSCFDYISAMESRVKLSE